MASERRRPGLGDGPGSFLGRGRDTLLGIGDDLEHIQIEKIRPNPQQPRTVFDEQRLQEMADSIKQIGFIQPLSVIRDGDGYILVGGERRLRAARLAGLETVPVTVRTYAPEVSMRRLALIENLQREDLNPVDEAEGYRDLMEEEGLTQEEVAESVGKDRTHVANYSRILTLPNDILENVRHLTLSPGHAIALASLDDPEEIRKVARQVIEIGLTVQETRKRVKGPGHKKRTRPDREVEKYQAALEKALGVPVLCVQGRKTRVVVTYRSPEDLRQLFERPPGSS